MAHRTLIATMGFDERHVLPSLRLMPYDRLVIAAGRDTFRSAGFRRLKAIEPTLRSVTVDPFDLLSSLHTLRRAILAATRDGPVRISVSGGTKILASAAILAAFQEGIEAWYCDTEPVRLPVLRGLRLSEAFPSSERLAARLIRGPVALDRLVRTMTSRGVSRRTALGAVRALASKGLVVLAPEAGRTIVRPSVRFPLLRVHLREDSGKA